MQLGTWEVSTAQAVDTYSYLGGPADQTEAPLGWIFPCGMCLSKQTYVIREHTAVSSCRLRSEAPAGSVSNGQIPRPTYSTSFDLEGLRVESMSLEIIDTS